MNLSILAILLSLVLLMYLAYRGFSVLLLAPLMALLAVLGSPGTPLLASYTQVFMKALGGFIALYFPPFLLGAVFGHLMESSGAARVIALRIVEWLGRRVRQAATAGEGYGAQADSASALDRNVRAHALGEGYDVAEFGPQISGDAAPVALPGFAVALAPIVAVVALNWLFSTQLLPRLDSGYLANELYGATRLDAVRGVWAIIAALALSILLLIGLAWRSLPNLRQDLETDANAAVLPIFNTASQVGYGAVIASLVGFTLIRDAVLGIAPGQPLISLSIAVNVLAGITGSASGGMSIALQTLGGAYLEMGRAAGISPELLHRVTSIATGGLDALPHNGAVITLLAICKLTHRQSYGDILVVAVITPLVALAAVVLLGTLLGSF